MRIPFRQIILGTIIMGAVLAPFSSFSQVAQAQRRSGWNGSNEDVGLFDEEDFQEFRRRSQMSSSIRRKIDALDDDRVDDVPIPILFGVDISDLFPNFGDPRSGGRTHEGLDILAPLGAPIVSPTEAVVVRIGKGSSAGNYVYTANPGSETFAYMHLNEIADNLESGDELREGDLIGYVGNTGNAAGGPAHLHLEIREGGATDPYPRLSTTFSIEEKIDFIGDILDDDDDAEELARFVVNNYEDELTQAVAEDIKLPDDIEDIFDATRVAQIVTINAPLGDLTIGSTGILVETLQLFLIASDIGPRATALAVAGATGYFGPVTQAALAEYQTHVGISPATGYFGPLTREHLLALKSGISLEDVTLPTSGAVVPQDVFSTMPVQDLAVGAQGAGVVWLQNFLITKSTGTDAVELSRVGATGYFGSLTQAALAEYQVAANIVPPVGYYGPLTRKYITQQEF